MTDPVPWIARHLGRALLLDVDLALVHVSDQQTS